MDFTKIFDFVGEIPDGAKYAAALIFVLILILFVSWILKKVTAKVRTGGRRGGRLKVQESIMVDASRTLTLVRCDNVEHLILLGGTNDLVVASNIQRPPSVVKNSPLTVALAPTVQPKTPQPAAAPLQAAPLSQNLAPAHPENAMAAQPMHASQPAPTQPQMSEQPQQANPMPHVPQPTHYRPAPQPVAQPLPTPAPRAKPAAPPPSPPEPAPHEPESTQAGPYQANGGDGTSSDASKSPSLSNIRPGDEK